jgi:hypothetical protein
MNKLEKEMGKYNTDICAVQEIRWPGKRNSDKKNCLTLYSRHKSDKHETGTGYYISRHIMDNSLHSEPVNEKI